MYEADERAPHQISIDSWWRTQSATMALLKHAYHLVHLAEQKIADQEKRICQLENLAKTDPLTGLMNRRGFELFFEHEQERIRRKHSPGALLILIDLNGFKHINDNYGHMAGDAGLCHVAERLKQSIRKLDGAARLGGDEFALLLTQLEPEKSALRLQRIRKALQDVNFEWQGRQLSLSGGVGMEIITGDGAYTDIYQSADAGLYADKQSLRQPKIHQEA